MKNKLLLALALLLAFSNATSAIDTKVYGLENLGLPFDVNDRENNRALIFTMTDESGRTRNIELMRSVFEDGKLGFKCEHFHNKSASYIYDKVKEVVGRMDQQGTLLLYLNSHGGGSGKNFGMTASGGRFKFSEVLKAIASVKKIKRLIVLVDTCHAEGAIDEGFQGGGKLIKNLNTMMIELPDSYYGQFRGTAIKIPRFMSFFQKGDAINTFYYGEDSGAYEEALIITSSSAEDLSMRGTFALNFKKAFEKVSSQDDARVSDFLKTFALSHSQGGQQPYYKCMPDSILGGFLFKGFPARSLPILDKKDPNAKYKKDYILVP